MSEQLQERHTTVAEGDPLVEVHGLRTYYESDRLFGGNPVKAVDGVSFDIRRGETLGLVGESGCGKTTLGRTLLRLERATGGTVHFDGRDVTELSGRELKDWRRNAQIVFQDPDSSLNDRMTVGEIIREPLDVHEWRTPGKRRERVRELLDTVGLQPEHYYRYPHQFSGGQRQRINIARTLTLEPEFIVLDEPVSALDVSVQAEIINLLEDLQTEFGLTYLFIAHDLSVVRHISDRVAVMYLGKIMEIGPTDTVFSDPANPYTHALLSAIPVPNPTASDERIRLHGTPPNPRYPPSGCVFKTRCPMRIKPAAHADMPDDVWDGIIQLEEILAERARLMDTLGWRIRDRLGRTPAVGTIDEIYDELFGEVEVPATVEAALDEVADAARSGDHGQAVERLDDAFGGPCGDATPDVVPVGSDGRFSRCHRHEEDYPSPNAVLADRSFE